MLRIIFSRLGRPYVGPSSAFSFNLPAGHVRGEVELECGDGAPTSREATLSGGMCPECEGLGRVSAIDVDQLVDVERSLNEGAITVPNFAVGTWYWQTLAHWGFVDPDVKLKDFTATQWEDFLHKPATKIRQGNSNVTYEGLVVKVQRLFLAKERESMQPRIRAFVDRAVTFQTCPACGGTRLNPTALSSKIKGRNIAECSAMQVSDLAEFIRGIEDPSVGPLVATLRDTLASLVEVGLGYLSLDRESGSLSGGEAQRVKMVRHLGSSLTDVTYVFDEPTVGLHPQTSSGGTTCCCGCATRATRSWWSSTSPR
jgi:excinuclease UvrABC ATPase subunit